MSSAETETVQYLAISGHVREMTVEAYRAATTPLEGRRTFFTTDSWHSDSCPCYNNPEYDT